jgi:biotin carboxyl carrier protein
MKYFVDIDGRPHEVELEDHLGQVSVRVDGETLDLEYSEVDGLGQFLVLSEGRSYGVSIDGNTRELSISITGSLFGVHVEDERERAAGAAERSAEKLGGLIKSVMPGIVVQLLVEEGQKVQQGQPLLILEAMKMQNEIAATVSGVVSSVFVESGQALASGEKLVQIEES